MRVALSMRIATPRQAETHPSAQQCERLKAHAQAQGWQIPSEHIFRDEGYSGASLKRPGLDRLRDMVAAAALDRVLITAPDRLARNYVHQVLLLEEWQRYGCRVEFLDRPMTQDPHAQVLVQIRGAVAEYERRWIAERMRRGRHHKLQAGLFLPWTRAPSGYRMHPERPRDPAGVRLEPAGAVIVQALFARSSEAAVSLNGLAPQLQAQAIPGPRGQERWNPSSIRRMLLNPVYTGQLSADRLRAVPIRQRGSALRPVGQSAQSWVIRPRED
jgi:site-specific DNA recombinase